MSTAQQCIGGELILSVLLPKGSVYHKSCNKYASNGLQNLDIMVTCEKCNACSCWFKFSLRAIFFVLVGHLKKGVGLMRVSMQDWTNEDALVLLSGWARSGLTFEQIASNMGISRNTLQNWRKKSHEIHEALRVSKEIADCHVENAMFKSAIGFYYKEQVVTNKGEVVWVEKYEKPNTTAQIFYLKNRKPSVWTDRRQIKHEAKIENVEYIAEWGKSE